MGGGIVLEAAVQNLKGTRAIFIIDSFKRIPKTYTEEEINLIVEKQRSRWTMENFQSEVYNWVKNLYHPESDSALMEWIAKDMSSIDPFVGIDSWVNSYIYLGEFRNSLRMIGDIPMICINARSTPNIEKYRDFGVNFNAVKIDNVSHFLMMSPADTFNSLLNSQLDSLLLE